jgi:dihydroorotate dehydrogenase
MFASIYPLLRPILFALDAERAHDLTLSVLKGLQQTGLLGLVRQPVIADPVQVAGIQFPNRVGLAAGLDKNGECIDAFAAMGFGHIEVGTVTPRPQPGNPKPRLFRLPEQQAVINRFGFNNKGVDHLIGCVQKAKYEGILGINVGKNFDTPVENAEQDYLICIRKVYNYASYITVNISSPNTTNLRQLQHGDSLKRLLDAIKQEQHRLHNINDRYVPIFIKVAPDLDAHDLSQLTQSFNAFEIDGVIATNTTFSRAGVENSPYANEQGGLSGAPLLERSNQIIAQLRKALDNKIPIIGVGGICSGEDGCKKIQAGAELVQIYSGFIYRGPQLVTEIATAIKHHRAQL